MFSKLTMTGVKHKRQESYKGNSKILRNMWDKGGWCHYGSLKMSLRWSVLHLFTYLLICYLLKQNKK